MTNHFQYTFSQRYISTHTLTWSVTKRSFSCYTVLINFNSHAHVERDDRLVIGFNRLMISTHTLTWSVTGS